MFEKTFIGTALTGMEDLQHVFEPASYHGCDYSFFYLNICENAKQGLKIGLKRKMINSI